MVVSIMGNHMYTILIYCFLLVKLCSKIIFGKTGDVKDIYTDIMQHYVTLSSSGYSCHIIYYKDAMRDNRHNMETAWELVKLV